MATATAAIPRQTAADPATDYARSVIDGDIVAPMPVRLACERHLRDLRNPDFVWDAEEVRRRLVMCRTLRHYKGPFKGRPFEPTPWQCFVIGSVFGWKLKRSGLRRFRKAFVMVPRKNGKTFLAASIAVMMLVSGGQLQADGKFGKEPGAEVFFRRDKVDLGSRLFPKLSDPVASKKIHDIFNFSKKHIWAHVDDYQNTQDQQ